MPKTNEDPPTPNMRVVHAVGMQLQLEDGQSINVQAGLCESEESADAMMLDLAQRIQTLIPRKIQGSVYTVKDVVALLGVKTIAPYSKQVMVMDRTDSPRGPHKPTLYTV